MTRPTRFDNIPGWLLLITATVFLFIFFWIAIVIAFGAWNASVRNDAWHDPNTRFDSELGWAPIPSRSIKSFGNKTVSSNSLGFRSPEVDPAKKYILIVGDSVAWGYGVGDDETMSAYLQKRYVKDGENVQVLNLGVSGYGIDQYVMWMKRNIDRTPPSAIIVVLCTSNDVDDTINNFANRKSKPLFTMSGGQLHNINGRISKYSWMNLSSFYYPYVKIPIVWRLQETISGLLFRMSHKLILKYDPARVVIGALFDEIYKISMEHDSELLFVLVPPEDDLENHVPNYGFRFLAQILVHKKYAHLNYFNLLKYQPKELRDKLYKDGYHFTSLGNAFFANVIYSYLGKSKKFNAAVLF